MAPGIREELLCSVCLSLYTDPVTLRCGHNFCRDCMNQVLNAQERFGVYSCPECRAESHGRPALITNVTLHKIAEYVRFTEPHQEEVTGICCTYCVDSPVPAVRSCLCEASLCDDHLRVHSKSPEHILTDPSDSLHTRKCSIHKKVLEYYCREDSTGICVSCCLAGEHRGHLVEMLDEASEKKKNELKNVLQSMTTRRDKIEEKVQSLEEQKRKGQEKASGEVKRVIALFIDLRRRVDDWMMAVLREISRQEMQVSVLLSEVIQKFEIEKDELSRKMRHIEDLCNMTDPLTVLQEPDTGDLCDPEEVGGDEDTWGHDETHDIDLNVIKAMLHAGFSDITTYLQTISPGILQAPSPPSLASHTADLPVPGTNNVGDDVIVSTGGFEETVRVEGEGEIYAPADILLNRNTAGDNILISDDQKTAIRTDMRQNYPAEPERFQYNQVIGSGFHTGRLYWDVEIRGSWRWRVGMCYPSIDRRGRESYIGYSNMSWCLCRGMQHSQYSVIHDNDVIQLPHQISSNRFRICVDYEAGELSFYELSDPIRHLHTFNSTFTEPLHAVLGIWGGCISISGGAAD